MRYGFFTLNSFFGSGLYFGFARCGWFGGTGALKMNEGRTMHRSINDASTPLKYGSEYQSIDVTSVNTLLTSDENDQFAAADSMHCCG